MNFTQIDDEPMRPGWGSVWQGNLVDLSIKNHVPGPLAIVCANEHIDEPWIDHRQIHAVLSFRIQEMQPLSDMALMAALDAGVGFLRNGLNLYVHCANGVARSTYYVVGLRMRVLGETAEQAFAHVKAKRPHAVLRPANRDQLMKLEQSGLIRHDRDKVK